ncbi:MAG: AraC family transcriptional regulator [Prevotella sp.]|nr:AraC family transcriptional regulator [Prevotella sp.]MBO5626866.1 AraC family transcriptional regulator [Prevotella sp.]
MTGPQLLIAAIIIVLVIAFIITVVLQNITAKKIISANTMLVENQNTLLVQNKMLTEQLQESKEALENAKPHAQTDHASQETEEVTMLREQTHQYREYIRQTADMNDEDLLGWIDWKMEQTHIFTDTSLTLKTTAQALGLTQKRLSGLFKHHPKYSSLGDYINEKRFLEGCRLLLEEPNWTIEAVASAAGFGGRRTFQTEVKRRLGMTPQQYRQANKTLTTNL